MSVLAKYTTDANDQTSLISGLVAAVAGSFGYQVGEAGTHYIHDMFSGASALSLTGGTTIPRAYLNYVFFDEDFGYVQSQSGYVQITSAASGSTPETLSLEADILKEGYLYIYIANESNTNTDVYFDDLEITLTESTVRSRNPFGLPIDGLSYEAASPTPNLHFYNGGSEWMKEVEMNSYSTPFRQYDPVVGRFTGVDLMAQETMSLTPYNFALNSPMRYNDPTGLLSVKQFWDAVEKLWETDGGGTWTPGEGDSEGTFTYFGNNQDAAFEAGVDYIESYDAWGIGETANSEEEARGNYNLMKNWDFNYLASATNIKYGSASLGKPIQQGIGDTHGVKVMTISDFVKANKGKTIQQITNQEPREKGLPGGPTMRYITDPQNPDAVIDLRHMLVVGYMGKEAGYLGELVQAIGGFLFGDDGLEKSALHPQDYYSNELGYEFYNTYRIDILANPTKFTDYLQEFLNNQKR